MGQQIADKKWFLSFIRRHFLLYWRLTHFIYADDTPPAYLMSIFAYFTADALTYHDATRFELVILFHYLLFTDTYYACASYDHGQASFKLAIMKASSTWDCLIGSLSIASSVSTPTTPTPEFIYHRIPAWHSLSAIAADLADARLGQLLRTKWLAC